MNKPVFSKEDIDRIAACLGNLKVSDNKDHYRLKLSNPGEKRQLSLEIYPEVSLGEHSKGALIVVYTQNCHLQLHDCSGYVVSEELGEVTFVSETPGKISGLVVEKEAACSLYSNAERGLISDDFTRFGVEVMLSGVALSLAEEILSSKSGSEQ
ncbi:MAG: hypothetical protein A2W25_16585 [candidate division Zixibacteria bacterium RBG_16_53_22]|nr:MAG: hypothetical protein A2W25_16585 [candidate division Zixibacteria bacterium RBG_16_53_22]